MQALLTDAPELSANELVMAKEMADTLHKHYPDHAWAVNVDLRNGVARIYNMSLSGMWGFLLHVPKTYSASEFAHRVMRGGGELLERYRVRRGRARADELAAVPKDFAGRKVALRD